MDVELSYQYKIYRDGIYLGQLPNVKSEFGYDQDINTPATEITVVVGQSFDTAHDPIEPIETEDGQLLTTENGLTLETERAVENIGVKDSGTLLANFNDLVVWEYSPDYPNGKIVFT